MAKKLTFEYDQVGDILYVTKVSPYYEQQSEQLADEVVARLNPKTGTVEGLEILFFSKRFKDKQMFERFLSGELRVAV